MGYIDESRATLTCQTCNITGEAKALEYGSFYGSNWSEFRSENFDVTSDGDNRFPVVVSARCKACGGEAVMS